MSFFFHRISALHGCTEMSTTLRTLSWALLSFFLSFLVAVPLANPQNISLGSELAPTQTTGWASLNRNFQISFYTSGPGDVYSLGILFNPINKRTVTWSAAAASGVPLQVGKDASLKLSKDGDLVLFGDLSSPLWRTNTSNVGVAGASMEESGNFILYNGSGGVIWQSFDSPTDTLLPGQHLKTGQKLTSSIYTADLEENGNFSLIWSNGIMYWSSDTSLQHPVYASLQQATFGLYNNQGYSVKSWRSSDYSDNTVTLRRVSLDEDGNLRIYSWSSSRSDWIIGWQALQDQCQVYGYCGTNGLCSYDMNNLICTCAAQAGYVPIDPSNLRKGCKGGNVQNCSTFNSMVVLNHTFVPSNIFYNDEADCQQACLKDSLCLAATATNDGSGSCLMKYGDSFSGYQEPNIASNSFLKVCGTAYILGPPPGSPSNNSKASITVAIVASILGTLVVVILFQLALWLCCCGKSNPGLKGHSGSYALLEYASGAPLQFTYRDLQIATRNFTEKLGEGGFGAVYKGMLPNMTDIAVKQLEGVGQGERQFRMEVAVIGCTHHVNLVRICGYCVEAKHRLLVYEFMKNGSLDRYLFNASDNSPCLEWPIRFNVLVGTARGIAYLHQECRDCIVHCDIKPENILLDENFCAKVSDFGLAKLINDVKDQARNLSIVQGTRGYLAPEWRSNLPITAKSDVFSFGVVMLETICGRKNSDAFINSSDKLQSFSEWAFNECFLHNRMQSIVDKRVRSKVNMEELDRAVRVSFWCMQLQPSLRPSMSKVVHMLEGMLPIDMPPMPNFFEEIATEEALAFHSEEINTDSKKHPLLLDRPSRKLSKSFGRATSLVINSSHTFNISSEAVPYSF